MGRLSSFVRFAGCASLVSAMVLAALGSEAGASNPNSSVRPHVLDIYATYYGWYTNTPPGCATAYSGCAGGTGTYKDPITFASDVKEFPVGTILYYPTVRKYFVMGDECTECTADWTGKGPDGGPHFHHVDLWIGGKAGTEFAEINCEDALTETATGAPLRTPFVVDPPSVLPVSRQPLFNVRTDRCFGGATASATYGEYQNEQSDECLEDASATPGTAATVAPCARSTDEDLEFDGAFLIDHNLCLEIDTPTAAAPTRTVSPLEWGTCTGNTREQWEIGVNGTIQWIQYIRCVDQVGTTVELSSCNPTTRSDLWTFVAEGSP